MSDRGEIWTLREESPSSRQSLIAFVLAVLSVLVAGVLLILVIWSSYSAICGGPLGVLNVYEARSVGSEFWKSSFTLSLVSSVLAVPGLLLTWKRRKPSHFEAASGRFSRLAMTVLFAAWLVISAWVIYLNF